jgi:outer membrane protein assembly factor BamD
MRSFLKLFIASLLLVGLFSCSKFNKVEKSKDIDYKLLKADEYYAKKSYRNARTLYEQLFPAMKGSAKFEDLYYKYAYCYFYEKQYSDAENLFKGYLEVFPNSVHAEEVDYMRAYSFYKQSPKLELEQVNTQKSMNMMQTFINQHIGSPRVKDATAIIDEGRAKLELKEAREAQLYYNLSQYRAAGIAFNNVLNNYPESLKGEQYKLMVVKSYYKFAKLSVYEKQLDRFEKVTIEYQDFVDRFPDSKLLKTAEGFSILSINNIKEITNEQTSPSARL